MSLKQLDISLIDSIPYKSYIKDGRFFCLIETIETYLLFNHSMTTEFMGHFISSKMSII